MNPAKLKQLEKVVRIGGKGSTRRKHKHIPRPSMIDENRLRSSLQKLPMSVLSGIQQVHFSMKDGGQKVMYYPKVECSIQSNVYIISSESSEIILPDAEPECELASLPQLVSIKDSQCLIHLERCKKKEKKPRIRCRARNKAMKAACQPDLVGDGAIVTSCTRLPAVQPVSKATGNGDADADDNDDRDKPDGGHDDGADNVQGRANGNGDGSANASCVFADNDPKHLVSIFTSSKSVPIEELLDILNLSNTGSSKETRVCFWSDSDSDLDDLLFGENESATKGGNHDKNQNQDRSV